MLSRAPTIDAAGCTAMKLRVMCATVLLAAGVVSAPVDPSPETTQILRVSGALSLAPGDTLVVEPGTRVILDPGASIEVARGATLIARGEPTLPIVFTCSVAQQGCWEGLIVHGRAPLNHGSVGLSGCLEQPRFGGCDEDDSSGVVRFVRIEYASVGLHLKGVGRGTTIDHLQVDRSEGDGVVLDGGTVDLKHLFLTGNAGRGLSYRGGWAGRGQFLLIAQDSADHAGGIEGSAEPGGGSAAATGFPRLYNVTLFGPADPSDVASDPVALRFRQGARGEFRNLAVIGGVAALDVDDSDTCVAVQNGSLLVAQVAVVGVANLGSPDPDPPECPSGDASSFESEYLAGPTASSWVISDPVEVGLAIKQSLLQLPDFRPGFGSALSNLSGAAPPADGFFDSSASFVGAVEPAELFRWNVPWHAGWTRPSNVVDRYVNLPPVAEAGGPYVGSVGMPVVLAGTGSDPDGVVVSYHWDFGDANSGTGPSPSHSYSAPGAYSLILSVTDNDGAQAVDTSSVSVSGLGSGVRTDALLKGGVRYRNFGSDGSREVYVGEADVPPAARTELDHVWTADTPITVRWAPATGDVTTTLGVPGAPSISYPLGSIGVVDYLQFQVFARDPGTTVSLLDVTLDGAPVATSLPAAAVGSQRWHVSGLDLSGGFTLEGRIVFTGPISSSDENNKVQIDFGQVPPH